jgi:hypothetical protein
VPTDRPRRLTFAELADLEPGLLDLVNEARQAAPSQRWDPEALFYGWGPENKPSFKQRLSGLVGWNAAATVDQRLRTSLAYEMVYETILEALYTRRRRRRPLAEGPEDL